jgi:diguanylate cyclase (GGDEF)-like protein
MSKIKINIFIKRHWFGVNEKSEYHNIGVLIDNLEGGYQSKILSGILTQSEKSNINLFIYPGKFLHSHYEFDYQYNFIFNLIDKNKIDGLIVFAGAIGNFLTQEELEDYLNNFTPIPMVSISTPLKNAINLLINNNDGFQDALNHLIEVHGYKKIAFITGPADHFEAKLRLNIFKETLLKHNIPFSDEYIIPGNFVINSGEEAVRIIFDEKKLDIDAIAAANDDMAIGALTELNRRKINVPKDVAIIGFNDTDKSNSVNPSITTVCQPLFEMGKQSILSILEKINNNAIKKDIIFSTNLVIRQSCGCSFQSVESLTKTKVKSDIDKSDLKNKIALEMINSINIPDKYKTSIKKWIKALVAEFMNEIENNENSKFLSLLNIFFILLANYENEISSWQKGIIIFRNNILNSLTDINKINNAMFLFEKVWALFSEIAMRKEMNKYLEIESTTYQVSDISNSIITSLDFETLLDRLALKLPCIGINGCYISLYDHSLKNCNYPKHKIPKFSNLLFAFNEYGRFGIKDKQFKFETKKLLPDEILPNKKNSIYIILPLFFQNENFGFIIFESSYKNPIIYESIRGQISTAYKIATLFNERSEAEKNLKLTLEKLEKVNKKLHRLSLADELTGLYNRRGFLTLGKQHLLEAKRKQTGFLIFFADMDNLKIINDKYGHDEGDIAIIKTAEILEKTFRQVDIIARFGGDEFVIIASNLTIKDSSKFINRLKKNFMKYNLSSKKPYELSLSYGVSSYEPGSNKTFEELITSADKLLYKEKRKKKGII